MKTFKSLFVTLAGILATVHSVNAQTVPDSTMVKIGKERAYYETLGKIYPPSEKVTVTETSIAGVKSYWFNESLTAQKRIIIYLHGGVYVFRKYQHLSCNGQSSGRSPECACSLC